HQICLLLFTDCSSQRTALLDSVQQFLSHCPNEFVSIFAHILVFEVNKHERLISNLFALPNLLLRRSSRLFERIFARSDKERMLILMLNILTDIVERLESSRHIEENRALLQTGYSWHCAILVALTKPTRSTYFEKCFAVFGDLSSLKQWHSFSWYRL